MNSQKIAGLVFVVAGIFGLMYGGFSYTQETHQVDVGTLHMSVDETKRVNVPVWAGIGSIVIGLLLLVVNKNQR